MLRSLHDSKNPRSPAPPGTPEQLFLDNVDLVSRLAVAIARRHHASADEAEEFTQELHCKLVEDDYAVFRKFKGVSSLKTYLTTVASHAFLDFRNRRWGKWRPSAVAKDLGPVAIRLEKLLYQERLSFDEACEILQTNYHVQESRRELEEIWKRLPPRTPRGPVEGEEQLTDLAAPEVRPEVQIFEDQQKKMWARVKAALQKALQELPMEDRLLVKLAILEGIKIATIAEMWCTAQKPLYRRRDEIRKRLRRALEREGVRWEQVADLLNRSDFGWGFTGRKPKKAEEN